MYHVIRRIHLFCGLLLLVFVLMYFLSGYVIIHESWFKRSEPKNTIHTEALDAPKNLSDDALSQYLQKTFDLRGQRAPADHRSDGSTRFLFLRPGTTHEAVVASGGKEVTITSKRFDVANIANGMHRLRGYHGGWLYCLWACFYDLASLALILFALSGIFLWYKSTHRRLVGVICLSLSLSFSAAMVLYLMLSK